MFMMIHGLATLTNQDIDDSDDDMNRSQSMGDSQNINKPSKKRDISLKQFDYLYKNKIAPQLDEKDKFRI